MIDTLPDSAAAVLARQRYAVLCPGAGTQRPGMATQLLGASSAAQQVFAELESASGLALRRISTDGSLRDLRDVPVAYPAVFATAVAAFAALRARQGEHWRAPSLLAGHSLGHIVALVCAGAVSPTDGLAFVTERAELMAGQAARRPGSMLSLNGAEPQRIAELCRQCPEQFGVVVVGCCNGPDRSVASGDLEAVRWLERRTAELDLGRATVVRTGLAAHSPLMEPVREPLRQLAARLTVHRAAVPVLSNLTGEPVTDADQLRAALGDHLTSPVRWDLCLDTVRARAITVAVDLGPGQAMASLAHAVGLQTVALNSLEPLDTVLSQPATDESEPVR